MDSWKAQVSGCEGDQNRDKRKDKERMSTSDLSLFILHLSSVNIVGLNTAEMDGDDPSTLCREWMGVFLWRAYLDSWFIAQASPALRPNLL